MGDTFYWHDYETSGTDYRYDRPVQFAGIRTDWDLNEIGEPLVVYCEPAIDLLPNPQAVLITGITPQQARERGVPEYVFAKHIHAVFSENNTCRVGYNNVGFDDPITRHLLHRNFYAPYECEWQNNNSRWDIIDLVRACGAFRPDGLEWCLDEQGRPAYSLAALAEANNIKHGQSHDALTDVRETLGLGRLIKARQPSLFDYSLKLRKYGAVRQILPRDGKTPIVHVSPFYGNERYCVGLLLPLMEHPQRKKNMLFYDLTVDPGPFLDADADTLAKCVSDYRMSHQYGLRDIALNKCPFIASKNILEHAALERTGLQLEVCERHLSQIVALGDVLRQRLSAAYAQDNSVHDSNTPTPDAEALYEQGGFLADSDAALLPKVRACKPEDLATQDFEFHSPHMRELLFRYRARSFPDTLSGEEQVRWRDFCQHRLNNPPGEIPSAESYAAKINELRMEGGVSAKSSALLNALEEWLDEIQT